MTTPASLPAPADVTATAISSTRITVAWSAVTGAAKYYVYQSVDGAPYAYKGTSRGTSLAIAYLAPNTSYSYTVQAVPAENTTSPQSAPATATTPP